MKYISLLSTLLLLLANQACAKTCPSGEYWDLKQCKPCPLGTYFDGSVCQPCAAGTFAPNQRSLSCDPCPKGEYQPKTGQDLCLKCLEGTISTEIGASSSDVCKPNPEKKGTTQYENLKQHRENEANNESNLEKSIDNGRIEVDQSFYLNVTSTNYHHHSQENNRIELKMKTRSLTSRCEPGTFIERISWVQEDVTFPPYYASVIPPVIKYRPVKTHPGQTCGNNVAFNLGNQPSPEACIEAAIQEPRCAGNQFMYSEQYTPTGKNWGCRCCKAINEVDCMTEQNFYGVNTNWDIYRYKNTPDVKGECCEKCSKGTYQPNTGRSSCIKCSAGRFSTLEGATSSNVCQLCPKGEYQPSTGQSSCIECSAGRYSTAIGATSSNVCKSCPPGSYQSSTGRSSCIKCSAGTYSTAIGATSSSVCNRCPQGEYQPSTGQSSCIKCAAGRFSTQVGATSSSVCKLCPVGEYQPSKGSGECIECPRGQFSKNVFFTLGVSFNIYGGATSCTNCPAGEYQPNTGQSSCIKCPAGEYQPNTGRSSCIKCLAGRFSAAVGATSISVCKLCPAGQYQPNTGQLSCDLCPQGEFQSQKGKTSCSKCPAGKFSTAVGATSSNVCKLCPQGQYQSNLGQSSCDKCSAGRFSTAVGATSSNVCTRCPAGEYQPNAGRSSCIKCSAGRYSTAIGATSSNVCTRCPAGEYQPSTGRSSCIKCSAGRYSTAVGATSSNVCTRCPAGQYQPNTGQASCINCLAGRFSTVVGATSLSVCEPCPQGEYQSNPGQSSCDKCISGRFSIVEGATSSSVCEPCPQGQYQPSQGKSSCIKCSAGEYQSNPGQSSCNKCLAGKFSVAIGANSSSVCMPCAAGHFQSKVGQSSCEACKEGEYQNVTGAVECEMCSPGEFANETASETCRPCPEKEYQFNPGQSFCYGCPHPLENLIGGLFHCSVCKEGYYLLDDSIPINLLLKNPRNYCYECPNTSTKCNAGTNIKTMAIEPGYWRASKDTSEVHKCNFKHICDSSFVGTSSSSMHEESSFYPSSKPSFLPSSLPSNTPSVLQSSHVPSMRTSSPPLVDSSIVKTGEYCAQGYNGALCEACISPNHFFDNVEGICKECKSSRFLIHLAIVTALILPIVSILWCLRSHLTPFSITIASLSAQAKIKVLIGFYQIMSSFTDIYGVTLHEQVKIPFRFLTYIFSFEFLSSYPLDCLKSEALAYILSGLWPYFICFGLGLCYQILKIIRRYFKRCCIDALLESTTFTQIAIVVLYLALPIASKHIFDAKICQAFKIYDAKDDLEKDKHASYLLSSRTIKCNSDDEKYKNLQILFWIFFILWPCLTLLGFATIVTKIYPSIRAGRPSDFAMNCQFIWRDFDPNSILGVFWDIIDFARKIFLIGFINFIDQNEGSRKMLRLSIGTAVSIVFLLMLLYTRPYKRNDDFQLSVLSSVLISLCFGLGYIIQICDNGDNSCKMYVGLKDSLGASILVTILVLGMLIVTILVLVLQSKLSPIARLRSTKYPPDLTLPEECTHHVFMSHKWKGGQDKCHSIARKLQLYMPGLKLWLDVDNLSNTTDLEDHVEKSVVFLLFYSPGYFKRRNCRREFFQAIYLEKTIVVVYDGDNSQLALMKNECKTVYKKSDEMYQLMEKCEDIPRSEWENKVNHLKNKIGIFISEQFAEQVGGDNKGNNIDSSNDESDALAIQWLKTGSYSSESLKLIYLRILYSLPCYASDIEAPMLSKGLKLPADKKPPPIKFNFELCFSSYNDGADNIASELQKMQSRFMSVIDLTTTKLSIDEENAIDSNPNPDSSEHANEVESPIAQDPKFSHNEENVQEASSLLSLESNGLDKHLSDNDSLPSCFSLEVSAMEENEVVEESKIRNSSEHADHENDLDNSEYEDEENEMSALLLDPDISTSTLAADLEIVKQLESSIFKVFLLYLNKDTFSTANINSFGPILKSVLLKGIPVIVVHEQDVKKGGRPNFDFFLDHTPSEFMSAYQDIAIPIYSLKEYRDVSLCCVLERIIEKYKRSTN